MVAPFLQVVGQDRSEVSGAAFDPSGSRLSLNSDRGGDGGIPDGLVPDQEPGRPRKGGTGPGITYEVTGPFRGARTTKPPGHRSDRRVRPFTDPSMRSFRLSPWLATFTGELDMRVSRWSEAAAGR